MPASTVDGPQTGDVHISFDGGPRQPLRPTARTATPTRSRRSPFPRGATTARPHFPYTGTNSAFWMIDQVALTL
ncbi:hypothetical protein AB0M64_16685 [Streptomyces sp. NPDC051771]|uniref:hypothetical protein n=1 Tax=Streptomyces sp. NPDC051771 TaxID=3154847 RepID=UPI00343148FB